MNRIILQVPMEKSLREQATSVARDHGFSSVQEAVRVLLTKFARREIAVQIGYPDERLTPRAERRYARILHDIKSGKTKTVSFESTKDMMAYLHSL